ncbi:MAG: type II toxin-antitoxin system prevent-host-death family antitoxin [Candidatus Sumerlaeota bacterium]|nr:type II toxin-antitoxin system prevent-host-death family antitoxin [Candidatus Sumerlaeota bacterium]
MTTLTATDARRELFDLVKGATDRHEVYRIHHRRGSAVLLSEEDYESLLETLELLSTPGFRRGGPRGEEVKPYDIRFTKEAAKDAQKLTPDEQSHTVFIHRARTHYGE